MKQNIKDAMKIATIIVVLFASMAMMWMACGDTPSEYMMLLGGCGLVASAKMIKKWCKDPAGDAAGTGAGTTANAEGTVAGEK